MIVRRGVNGGDWGGCGTNQWLPGSHSGFQRTSAVGRQTHAALHVLQLWQDVQGEAVRLPSRAIASVHEVSKGQHEAEDL